MQCSNGSQGIMAAAAFAAAIILGVPYGARAQMESSAATIQSTAPAIQSSAPATKSSSPVIQSTSTAPAMTARDKALATLDGVEQHAKQMYNVAEASDWENAAGLFRWFALAYGQVLVDVAGHAASKNELSTAIPDLKSAIDQKNVLNTMAVSNAIISAAIDMKQSYNPPVPVEVEKLGCYSRDIEIYAGADSLQNLGTTARAIEASWREARGGAIVHGGAAPAKEIDAIVEKLLSAVTSRDYEALSLPLRENADKIEAVYLQSTHK